MDYLVKEDENGAVTIYDEEGHVVGHADSFKIAYANKLPGDRLLEAGGTVSVKAAISNVGFTAPLTKVSKEN